MEYFNLIFLCRYFQSFEKMKLNGTWSFVNKAALDDDEGRKNKMK